MKGSVVSPRVVGGVLLTPDDFLIKASISWVGSIEATDPELQQQRALQRIQILQQIFQPMGVVTREYV